MFDKILIFGLSRSGKAAYRLMRNKTQVLVFDDDEKTKTSFEKKENIEVFCLIDYKRKSGRQFDFIVLSPSISADNSAVQLFLSRGEELISELELGYRHSVCKIIAVTGSNGKTTTVSLIAEMLKQAGISHALGGNIGTPFCEFCEALERDDYAVLEVSSFQLEFTKTFKPDVACVTNLSPNHLDRHGDYRSYISTKHKIAEIMTENGELIINLRVMDIFCDIDKPKKTLFSLNGGEGVCAEKKNNKLYYNGEELMNEKNIVLIGEHNKENALAAICVAKACGVNNEAITIACEKFHGVEHRIELYKTVNGVNFYDDSKSTTVEATKTALAVMGGNTYLILGGSDKMNDYAELFSSDMSKVSFIAAIGETAMKIVAAALDANYHSIKVFSTLCEAVHYCYFLSSRGENVLLSPATASFDMFENFEARGDAFKTIVDEIAHG